MDQAMDPGSGRKTHVRAHGVRDPGCPTMAPARNHPRLRRVPHRRYGTICTMEQSKSTWHQDTSGSGEDIHIIDFEASIESAESDGRYRDAVRLQYLKTLKLLTDAGRIQWKQDKTNASYASELAGTELADSFDALTYIYDCTWYGDMPVSGDAYTKIKPGFLGFRERLRS